MYWPARCSMGFVPVPVVIGCVIVLLAAALVAFRLITAWWKYLGDRVITCPENHRPAGVTVDSSHAAWTGLARGPHLRLSACSRWPEMAGCGQECLSQIEASPEGCLVRRILVDWYAGKACASCGWPKEFPWSGNRFRPSFCLRRWRPPNQSASRVTWLKRWCANIRSWWSIDTFRGARSPTGKALAMRPH